MVAGVCGGLGEYLKVDPILFRILFVLALIVGGSGLLVYIVLWIVVPEGRPKRLNTDNLNHEHMTDTSNQTEQGFKQGAEPRGIMASGWVTTPVFQDLHWDEPRAAQGHFTNYIRFEYDKLIDPDREAILEREYLKYVPGLSQFHWDTRSSGIRIGTAVLRQLESTWAALTV